MHMTFSWEATHAGIRLTLPEVSAERAFVQAEATVRNESEQARACSLVTEIRDREGKGVASMSATHNILAKPNENEPT
jgi:hypothetical protein